MFWISMKSQASNKASGRAHAASTKVVLGMRHVFLIFKLVVGNNRHNRSSCRRKRYRFVSSRQSPYWDAGFQRVLLKRYLNSKVCSPHVHGQYPRKVESANLSRHNLSRAKAIAPLTKRTALTTDSRAAQTHTTPTTSCLIDISRIY